MSEKSPKQYKRKAIFLHASYCFYAGIWGIILGIVYGVMFQQRLGLSSLWLLAAGSLLVASIRFSNIFTLPLAICAGFLIASYRIQFDLVGQKQFAQITGRNIILSGTIVEDPDLKDNMVALRLSNVAIRQTVDVSSVENMWKNSGKLNNDSGKIATNCVKNVEKTLQNCGEIVEKITNSRGKNVQNFAVSSVDSENYAYAAENTEENGETWFALSGIVYVRLSTTAELERSDKIILDGKLSDGFGTFAASMYRPKLIEQQKPDPPNFFVEVKNWFSEVVHKIIPSPAADLGLGYLMGLKTGLPDDLIETLRIVGMTHVVVASGAHLGILTNVAKKIFGKFSKFAGTFAALLMICFFVFLVGFTPSMTRAGLVAGLSLLVGYVGRKFSPLRLISLVAALTLLIAPINLLNLGWQLSFASFFGILVLVPRIQQMLYGGKKVPWLASMLITSIATSLVCAPILIYNFGSISLLSLVANLIILPTLPYAMLTVFLAGVTSFWALASQLFGTAAYLILNLHISVVNFLSEKTIFVFELASDDARIFLIYLPIAVILIVASFLQLRRKNSVNSVLLEKAPENDCIISEKCYDERDGELCEKVTKE